MGALRPRSACTEDSGQVGVQRSAIGPLNAKLRHKTEATVVVENQKMNFSELIVRRHALVPMLG